MLQVVQNAPVAEAPENHPASEAQEAEQTTSVDDVEASEAEAAANTDEQPQGQGEGESEGQAEELDVIEYEGKQYQIPKPLKPGFMMQSDYTRKTQEVAEQRRQLEQGYQALQASQTAHQEEITERAKLVAIDAMLQNYDQINWAELEAQDPVGAGSQFRQYQQLKDQRAQVENALRQWQSKRTETQHQDLVRRIQETRDHAQKNIKGWTPETDKQLIDFATSKGFSQQELAGSMDKRVYEMLYLANIGAQTLAKQTAAPKQQAKPVQPTKTVGGKSNPAAGKSLADMSMEEYVAYRESQKR